MRVDTIEKMQVVGDMRPTCGGGTDPAVASRLWAVGFGIGVTSVSDREAPS